ncbi:hypothetical protein N9Q15_02290 [Amylibacter sp.]|nr:hypothetical protein [Amylibacter sp.]
MEEFKIKEGDIGLFEFQIKRGVVDYNKIALLSSLPERISNCPLSTSSKLIDGCFGEVSALNGPDIENIKRPIRVNPTNPFFKTTNAAKSGENSFFEIIWCS